MGKAYRNTATKFKISEPEETPQGSYRYWWRTVVSNVVFNLWIKPLCYAPGVVTENRGSSVAMFDSYSIRGFSTNNVQLTTMVFASILKWLEPTTTDRSDCNAASRDLSKGLLLYFMARYRVVWWIWSLKRHKREPSTKVGVATGSRNLQEEASIDTTGQFGDSDFSYRLIALARKQDSQVDNAEEERYQLFFCGLASNRQYVD